MLSSVIAVRVVNGLEREAILLDRKSIRMLRRLQRHTYARIYWVPRNEGLEKLNQQFNPINQFFKTFSFLKSYYSNSKENL